MAAVCGACESHSWHRRTTKQNTLTATTLKALNPMVGCLWMGCPRCHIDSIISMLISRPYRIP